MTQRVFIYPLVFAALAVLTACVRENVPGADGEKGPSLTVLPAIFNGDGTKAEDTDPDIQKGDLVNARDDLRENFFGSLDVFVKRQDAAEGAAWFKQYHLSAGDAGVVIDPDKYDSESLLNEAKQLLANNWAEQGYELGVPYDIYVTANNPHTAAASAPTNLTGLKALQTNSTDIYRYYLNYTPSDTDPVYWSNCMYSEKKNFLMDGKIEGWQIDPSSTEQVFDVDLKRAAAKVILTVKFSDDKTIPKVPEPTPSNPNPEPEKDDQGRVIYCSIKEYMDFVGRTVGVPRWKAVNFNLNGSDIAYDGDALPANGALLTLDSNFTPFQEGTSSDNTENSFALVTYTYSVDWSADEGRTPYILLSVFYTSNSDNTDQLRSYYRIPVCDENTVTSLDRNNVYIVDVEIASLGASNESFEAKDEELRIEYHVIPWTETNMSQEATTVKITDTKYLTILPTEYTLKGDGNESVDMLWYASVSIDDGRIVDIDPSTLSVSYVNYLGNTTNIRGTVTKQVRNDSGTLVTATDANTDGKRDIVITATAPSGSTAQGEKVVITLTPNGLMRVESEALASRAVKDISFKVYLKNATGVEPVTITVRHFPLDNIQSYTGLWSSRWNPEKEYTFDLATAESWGNYKVEEVEANASDPGARMGQIYKTYTTDRNTFRNAVPSSARGSLYTSKEESYHATDGYDYWGTPVEYSSYSYADYNGNSANNYDYYIYGYYSYGGTPIYTYYNYSAYYRGRLENGYVRDRYYHYVNDDPPSTGDWVAWGEKNGTTQEGIFTAKVYYNGQCYPISSYNTRGDGSGYTNLTNNHMYVIQITSTSNKYSLGKPVLDRNYQSQDKVASPAFMIASQLGAVTPTTSPTVASIHCGTYMEVEEGTGKRFVGWRLPTKQEVEVIIGYQNGEYTNQVTMVEVLGGRYYWALDGTAAYVSTGTEGTENNAYVRCVRDLTLEEVNALNKTN